MQSNTYEYILNAAKKRKMQLRFINMGTDFQSE